MDNITHTVTAIALSNAGLNKKTRYATLALVIGCNLPDIDIVTGFWGSATYLKDHRGITHSLLGITVLAVILAGVIYLLGKREAAAPSKPAMNVRWLLLICWIATASHLLMDFTNAYGVRPFLPFSGHWYAWDIEFIFDPLLLVILLAGLAVPGLFRIVTEEVGARKPGFRRGAIVSLCGVVALWGLRDIVHRRVVNMLSAVTYNNENPQQVAAFPAPTNPFQWTGVVETQSGFTVVDADALAGNVDRRSERVFQKPQDSPALEAAMDTRTVKIFLDFARFPWAEIEPTDNGETVIFHDLRFYSPELNRGGFVALVKFDKDMHIVSQSFSLAGPLRND
jgi:inner membrane protein